jgi:outer membrane protein
MKSFVRFFFSLIILTLAISFTYAAIPTAVSVSSLETKQTLPAEKPLTLTDCYHLALKQSEIIGQDAELIKEAEAHFVQALGAILPHVTFESTIERQDKGSNNVSSFIPVGNTSQRTFIFKQMLFSGFKEFAGMAGAHLERSQRENEKARAEQLLFVDVADAFYLLLEEQEDFKTLLSIKKALLDRIEQLNERERIGRSRRSEVVNTETQLYSVEADIELSKGQVDLARQLLEFLVGRPVSEIADIGESFPSFLKPEIEFTSRADTRRDVRATKDAWEVAKKGVAIARADFFPTISAETDYFTHRTTLPTDQKWDALLTIDVPIFQGTETIGAVKAARAQAKFAELQFQRTKRLALTDILDAYASLNYDLLRVKALNKALKAAEMNYLLQNEDYKLSVVNNLDVLAAIQSLQNTRRNYIHSYYETKRFYWQLLIASGEEIQVI